MKRKITKKELKKLYPVQIKVGYCKLQAMLVYKEPEYFISSIYGWECDVYIIDEIAIVTGSNPFGNVPVSYYYCDKFNSQALRILHAFPCYSTQKIMLDHLCSTFVNKMVE